MRETEGDTVATRDGDGEGGKTLPEVYAVPNI